MINVYIVSGFLGSGKTTFIKQLLKGDLKDVLLIENEFGEASIDARLFAKGLRIKEINSGCICCSLKGDLKDALEEIKKLDVKNLIIEPSGVGKLSEIMSVILMDDDLRLKSHICMVDAKKALAYHRNFKEFFDDQVIGANALILSKTEELDDEKIAAVVNMLKELNDEVNILTRPYLKKEPHELMELISENTCACECCVGCFEEDDIAHLHHDHHHHHHHADEIFSEISFKTERIFTKEELFRSLIAIKDEVVRAKGIVKSDKLSLYFDISGDDINIYRAAYDKEPIVVFIGTDLDESSLKEKFS